MNALGNEQGCGGSDRMATYDGEWGVHSAGQRSLMYMCIIDDAAGATLGNNLLDVKLVLFDFPRCPQEASSSNYITTII